MLNNIVAVVSGVAVGMVLNMALIRLNFSVLFPVPEGLDTSDIEQTRWPRLAGIAEKLWSPRHATSCPHSVVAPSPDNPPDCHPGTRPRPSHARAGWHPGWATSTNQELDSL